MDERAGARRPAGAGLSPDEGAGNAREVLAAGRPAADSAGSPGLGILMMLVGIFLFVCNDVMGKWLVATYSVGQVLLIRSLFALVLLAPMIRREGLRPILNPPRPGLQLLRIVFSTLEVAAFYWAVAYLPLADVVTFYLSGPIWVTALAGPLLGEKVGWRRWTAVLVGFAGVVIAMRPSQAAFGLPALTAVAGSLLFALLMITTRRLRQTSGVTLVTWQVLGALAFGAVAAPFHWVTPTPKDFLLLGMLGVVATVAHICVNRALALASAAVVVPYQYTQIAWAVLLGWLVFGDLPEAAVFAGSAVIVAAGLYIFLREQALARKAAAQDPS
ncbi:DMT family transporter [Alsobacter sp. KACC 23698]|uniref:DMT family transporter n=2 Tax=Alsobacter sp. KACC 23698 TaxID=3149229 RepID=A0AAU7JK81_9HYPH